MEEERAEPTLQVGVCFQDVLYPVEAVVQAGGYVLHQVAAEERLRTGDQVQLHLDQVERQVTQWPLSCRRSVLLTDCPSGPQVVLHGEPHGHTRAQLGPEGGAGRNRPAKGLTRVRRASPLRLQH